MAVKSPRSTLKCRHVFRIISIRRPSDVAQPVIRSKNGGDKNDRRRREYSPDSAAVEAGNRGGPFGRSFAQKYVGNDKSRDDKEHIDTQESAVDSWNVRVVKNDERDRERANCQYIGAKLGAIVI